MTKLLLTETAFPRDFLADLRLVRSILLNHGAQKIILYGSLAKGDYRPDSDIDVCVEGLPDQKFFRALAECLLQVHHHVSVLDLKTVKGYLRQRILTEGRLLDEQE